jgi:DNA invertase Pin-like site-specific DNA recombinase
MARVKKQIIVTTHNVKADDETNEKKVLRAAAYCRVSTLLEEQDFSFESQVTYYRTFIETNPMLTLVDIYGDHGLSGLRMESRPELQRLIQDCKDGKVDVIYTKSISRIARNAAECQKLLDTLHENGVYVIFEKEQIKSNDERLRLVLKLLASFAQQQSNVQSQAIRWSVDASAAIGKPVYKACYGYRKAPQEIERHKWIVHEEEAEHVRMMFDMIEAGGTSYSIAQKMNEIERKKGSDFVWYSGKICGMLRNIAYVGDILTNKTVVADYLSGKPVKNEGLRNQYYLEDHHPAIISREQFEHVQKLMTGRKRGRSKRS